jgi:hypothetical protein
MKINKIRLILKVGIVGECGLLANYAYRFYMSGSGLRLNMPYCSNYVIPYWFLALVIASPILPKVFNKSFNVFNDKSSNGEGSELANMIASISKGNNND